MGRKRKEDVSSIDDVLVNGPQEEYTAVEGKPLDNSAFGIAKNENGYYQLVEVRFNLETGEAGELIKHGEADSRDLTEERFRILVAQKMFRY